jgi:hypothetical protein
MLSRPSLSDFVLGAPCGRACLVLHPIATLSRKRQLLELCARIGFTPPLAV